MNNSKKVYLDTNIVANVIDSTRMGHELSLNLLKMLVMKNYDVCISEDMLSTLFYISKNKTVTLQFFKNVILIDWKIIPFGRDIIKNAIDLSLTNNLDLEDILQCLCAKENGCSILITNDKKFYDCGIEIMPAEEFLQ